MSESMYMTTSQSAFRPPPKQAPMQKHFGKPRHDREYQRFSREKIANTGIDPQITFKEFIKKDIVAPLEKVGENIYSVDREFNRTDQWAIKTSKHHTSPDKVPKFQQYKEYYFPTVTEADKETYRKRTSNTDYFTLKIPDVEKIKSKTMRFTDMKNKYGMCAESESWVPLKPDFSVNNNSSVVYNIISGEDNPLSGFKKIKIFDKKVTNRKKGIAAFSDLTRSFFPNYNEKYPGFVEGKVFNMYNGVFTHMYNAAHRNGNLVVPFREKKKDIEKEPDYSLERGSSPGPMRLPVLNTEGNQTSTRDTQAKPSGNRSSNATPRARSTNRFNKVSKTLSNSKSKNLKK